MCVFFFFKLSSTEVDSQEQLQSMENSRLDIFLAFLEPVKMKATGRSQSKGFVTRNVPVSESTSCCEQCICCVIPSFSCEGQYHYHGIDVYHCYHFLVAGEAHVSLNWQEIKLC